MYPTELGNRDATDRNTSASDSDLFLAIGRDGQFRTALCDKRWLVVLRINVDLAIFQPYLDLESGDNQSLKIQVARPGIEPRSSCSASQDLKCSATAAPATKVM